MLIQQGIEQFIKDIGATDKEHADALRYLFESLDREFTDEVKSIIPDIRYKMNGIRLGNCICVEFDLVPIEAPEFLLFRTQKAFKRIVNEFTERFKVTSEKFKSRYEKK